MASTLGNIAARLDRLPMSRRIWSMVLILSLGGAFEFYDIFFTAYVSPGMVADGLFTKASLGPLGFLFDLFGTGPATFVFSTFAGLFVGTLFLGSLADRFGRRRVFLGALTWYSVCTAIMAFQPSGFLINTWRFISGIGLGVQLVTIATYISELVPREHRGRAFAFNQLIQFSSVPVVAFLAWTLAPVEPLGLKGWRWVMLIGAIGAVAVLAMRKGLPESPRWLARSGRLDEAEALTASIEASIASEVGGVLPPIGPELPDGSGKTDFAEIWKGPYRKRTIVLSIFNFFQAIGFYGFAAWVPTLLISKGITITTSLLYSFVIALANPIGPLLGYFVADRFERKWQIVAAAFCIATFGMAFGLQNAPLMLIMFGVLVTLSNNWLSFSFHNYQSEVFPTRIRSRAVGFVYSWSRLSSAFAGLAIGFLLHNEGIVAVFAFIAGAMLIVMISIGGFGPRTRGRSLEEICPEV